MLQEVIKLEYESNNELSNPIYPDESSSISFDVSGNTYYISVSDPDIFTQTRITESLQEIQSNLNDSDSLTNDVFVRYSLACTLIICLCVLVFNHKR